MPKKRPHHKSRFGCEQCRKRRVKCDEKAPRCSNCINRDELCAFPLQQRTSPLIVRYESEAFAISPASTILSVADATTSRASPGSNLSTNEPDHLTHAALMHHWCTKTCHTFSRNGSDLFREHVGKEALHHQYLLDAIFSVTLLHQASELDDLASVRHLAGMALQYQSSSIAGLRNNLTDISLANCDALFICSILIMVSAIVSPLLPVNKTNSEQSTSNIILLLITLMSGVSSIVDTARPWIEQGPLHQFFGIVEPQGIFLSDWPPATSLHRLVHAEVGLAKHRRQMYNDAITGLNRVQNREICAVTWIMQIGPGLIESFREGDIITMTIFMHWAVLLQTTDDMWWKQFAGTRLVDELSASLVCRGDNFEIMSRWCKNEIRMDRQELPSSTGTAFTE